MIKSFKHKGLKNFFEKGDPSGLNPIHTEKIKKRLFVINRAETLTDIDLPGLRLHTLKGELKNLWAVDVSANYRITFKFEAPDAYILDYQDYH